METLPPQNLRTKEETLLTQLASQTIRNASGPPYLKTLKTQELWVITHLKIPTLQTDAELQKFTRNSENRDSCRAFENPQRWSLAFLAATLQNHHYRGPLLIPVHCLPQKTIHKRVGPS